MYGKSVLINKNAEIVKKLSFVDDFSQNYTRANKGGKIVIFENNYNYEYWEENKKYLLQVPNFNYNGLSSFFSSDAFCHEGKWGIIDSTGNFVVEPKYKFLQKTFRREFIAQKDEKWGVISKDDFIKIDFIYDEIKYFIDKSTKKWADIPYYKVRMKNKWGVIDSIGNIIIDIKFNDINYIYNNDIFFITKTKFKENIFGYIDTNEFMKIKHNFYKAGNFKNGRASIKIDKNKYNFINKSGELICNFNFLKVNDFRENLSKVKTIDGWGFIDTLGNFVIEPKYQKVGNFNDGLAFTYVERKLFFGLKKYKAFCFIDKNEKIKIKAKFESCTSFHNGLSILKKGKYYGIINTKGKYFIKPKFKAITLNKRTNNFTLESKNKRYALINSKGDFIVNYSNFETYFKDFVLTRNDKDCLVFSERERSRKKNSKIFTKKNVINDNTEFVERINDFSEGLASYEINKLFALYDKKGNCITKDNLNIKAVGNNIFRLRNINEIKYCKDNF